MSRLDQLTAHLCPSGVPFRMLGDVGTFTRGNGLQKKDFAESGVGCIHYGQIHTHYGTWATKTFTSVSPALGKRLRHARSGDLVIATTSEDDDALGKAVAWLGTSDVAVSGDAYIYRHSLDPKYVAYFFQSAHFQTQKQPYITGTKVRRISGESLARIRIPVPPVEVQREIANVLDSFAELEMDLEAELEAEVEARQQQHQHYCDALLGRAESRGRTPALALGDIANFTYGYTAKAADAGDYRFIRITDITEQGKLSSNGQKYVAASEGTSKYLVAQDDLLVARTGGTFGKTLLITNSEPAVFASFLIRVRVDQRVLLPAYYWHFAQSSRYWKQARRLVSNGGQPQFNANVLKAITLHVPPLEDQARVVSILDKFDALVNDLLISLPAELNARRQQYEYYRDRLFAFPELAQSCDAIRQ